MRKRGIRKRARRAGFIDTGHAILPVERENALYAANGELALPLVQDLAERADVRSFLSGAGQ